MSWEHVFQDEINSFAQKHPPNLVLHVWAPRLIKISGHKIKGRYAEDKKIFFSK
jgi:hypothetical protein